MGILFVMIIDSIYKKILSYGGQRMDEMKLNIF